VSAELISAEVDGDRAGLVLPTIPDDAPALVREGLARRRITAATGHCPCGARVVWPNRAERRAAQRTGRALRVTVVHDDECPATNENLIKAERGAR
jgi:hypothetical protein